MSDRKALEKTLGWYADMTYLDEKDAVMVTAARERLAQLPPYSDELVERIAQVFGPISITSKRWAVHVLDVLGES